MKYNNNMILGVLGGIGIVLLIIFFMNTKTTHTKLSGVDFIQQYKNTPDAILLDVRTEEEFASGHIDTATNIDFQGQSFDSEIAKLDTTKPYFVYCRSGNRSGQAVAAMKARGFTDIYELDGGLMSNENTIGLVTVEK